uniref:Galaxin-like n=1 Tax=Crassostrea virginica TaxID=6565 RepID=A0A8B8AJA7_CRAVI|nr:galaxin-like [Crassostrea virginica]
MMQPFRYLQVLCMFAAHHGLIAGSKVVDNICVFKTDDERLIEVPFDNASQICCEKGVHNKKIEGTEIECCGGIRIFRPSIEICCNDTVYLKDSIRDYRICKKGEQETDVGGNKCVYINDENRIDGALYNKSTHLCCMNSVHKKREQGIEVECCGEKTYRPTVESCCNGQVLNKHDERKLCSSKTNNLFGNDEFSPKDQSYTANTDVCCGHIVKKRLIHNLSERWLMKLLRFKAIHVTIHIDKVNLFTKSKLGEVIFNLADSTGFSTASLKSKFRKFFIRE